MFRFTPGSTRVYPILAGCSLVVLILFSGLALAGQSATTKPHWDANKDKSDGGTSLEGGFIPPSFSTANYAASIAKNFRPDKALPQTHDCRDYGTVSSVKNQGACGSCYAFGSAGDLESRLLVDGLDEVDLSENSIKECNFQGTS